MEDIKKLEKKYSPLNYWGWLENISPDEVMWQIEQMDKVGLGGYVMHARGGLEIPYMGQQWLDSVEAMIKKGKECEMLTIIDDEYGWPSGFGAGIVNGMGEEYWEKWLVCEEKLADEIQRTKNTLGYYIIEDNKIKMLSCLDSAKKNVGKVIHIYYESSKYYVDNLDPKVVKKFIEVSYEKYYEKFDNEFGKGIYAIFSDEPQISRAHLTWSGTLPSEFEKRFGYNILDKLPALFYDVIGEEKFRYDYWKTINSLFVSSYAKQIGEWCDKHNVIFVGHTLCEDHLIPQIMCSGGTMPFYEHMQIPGMDWLGRTAVSSFTIKQLTSVAQQLGKERILSEMYGCAGWNVSFEDLKWIGELHYVLGVNMMLQHLGLYSLKGSRKREYPASLFYQQPWWKDYNYFNDYFCRLSKLMTESKPIIDILVIHPLKSAWSSFNYKNLMNVEMIDKEIKGLINNLLSLNYDFHFGDEDIIGNHGTIENNKFVVGKSSYKMVIIPHCTTLDKRTFELIKEFYCNGGIVISVGSFPEKIEAEFSNELCQFGKTIENISNNKQALQDCLENHNIYRIKISLTNGDMNEDVLSCMREYGGDNLYYIVNTSKEKRCDFKITFLDNGKLYLFDLITCEKSEFDNNAQLCLSPTQSMLLIQKKETIISEEESYSIKNTVNIFDESHSDKKINIDHNWDLKFADMNCLVMDYCSYKIDNGQWEDNCSVISLQEKMIALGKPANVEMKFRAKINEDVDLIGSPIYLAIEEPDKFVIDVNGYIVQEKECGWWIDKSIKKIPIQKYLINGENIIVLKRYFYCTEKVYIIKNDVYIHEAESNRTTVNTELENIYLLGNFHVKCLGKSEEIPRQAMFFDGAFEITQENKDVDLSNLCLSGYPFFAGSLKIIKNINIDNVGDYKKYILKIGNPYANVVKVYINNVFVRSFLWAPYELDICEYLNNGINEIQLELVNSCRNLFGPHHNIEGEIYGVGPLCFTSKVWLNYEERTFLDIWTDKYCFVKFGIEGDILIDVIGEND